MLFLFAALTTSSPADTSGTIANRYFARACATVPAPERRASVCDEKGFTLSAARAFVDALPTGGDWGMPDAWSALHVARAQFALAGPTAWGDTAWDDAARLHRRPAIHALLRALELDSAFVPALTLLQDLCPYPHLWDTPAHELQRLRAVPLQALPKELYAERVMLELETSSGAAPRALVDSLAQLAAPTPELAYLDALATVRADGTPPGWSKYLTAIAIPGGAATDGWAAYEAMLIADSTEQVTWHAIPEANRARWLREFWERRDQEIAAAPGTRWALHQARWTVALQQYRLWPVGNPDAEHRSVELMQLPPTMVTDPEPTLEAGNPHRLPRGVFWSEPLPPGRRTAVTRRVLDDRGLIYIRHGEPREAAVYWSRLLLPDKGRLASDPSGNPMRYDPAKHDSVPLFEPVVLNYTTWKYRTTTGEQLLSFGQLSTASPAMWAFDFPRGGDLGSPCHLDPRFCIAIMSDAATHILREEGHAAILASASSDDDAPVVGRSAGLITEAYALAGGGVLIVYAVPIDSVIGKAAAPVSLRLTVASFQSGAGVQQRREVTRVFHVGAGSTRDKYFTGWLELPTTPGKLDVAMSVFTNDSSVGSLRRHPDLNSPPFDGHVLAVSQPVLGRDDAELQYDRHGEPVALNPTNAWHLSEPATIYYELDGLVIGGGYETTYEVWPTAGKAAAPALAITSVDSAASTHAVIQRELGLQQLTPGSYRLVIRIRDTATAKAAVAVGYLNIVN